MMIKRMTKTPIIPSAFDENVAKEVAQIIEDVCGEDEEMTF